MKTLYLLILTILLSCDNSQKSPKIDDSIPNITIRDSIAKDSTPVQRPKIEKKEQIVEEKKELSKRQREWIHFLHNRESENFIYNLEQLSDSSWANAYKVYITSRDRKASFSKTIDAQPNAARISYCNDLYTVIGYACGGPCFSRTYVFTDEKRPIEQYYYAHKIEGYPHLITYIKDEEFQKIILHNFNNNKEMVIDLPDIYLPTYGKIDSIYIKKHTLHFTYYNNNQHISKKSIPINKILTP